MLSLSYLVGIASALVFLLLLVGLGLPSIYPDNEKLSAYECGFDPMGSARLPFSLRFFLVAILFLLFDLEIALILPYPMGLLYSNHIFFNYWLVMLLIIVLTFGLMYEWLKGGLEWME
ncbi:NADH dehydrogenase subunit 3 (mitochondrion) [Branchiostoma belcheri]|uniref:NADH-ubiquinone oxidoreductase chain 3 n=2 Tax=Branchiostoma TaxID=7737 RepID=Q85CT1_BRABE|nr:NADH dehydrogenase subunit 3 [Branchiostoma belcheri]YP_626468.1 NADH dehydrogenase subunit 3 [Branchiostoma japonicum]ABD48674.1 NADH dehydrogenase subunit 3 [Branchiostoma japonicum]BAC55199.1 NADH dehydrogenase subunit 3 [Branchiostoma belcheri]BAC75499.1 NADH dehydrogenase subunit 3 [Branchiostoma belcheri]BAC75512.1 NADH dehydrogenase subunit 3 [Branchiostoma belcheri]BAH86074.1 NADH dehydrogenase subunit 3 [Branchiostoma belcheri]